MALRAVTADASSRTPTPHELAQAKWRSSGLSDKHAKRLRLRALLGDQTEALGSNFHAVPALHIPYFDLKGKPTKFFRIRYLGALPGFAGQVAKPQRYAQQAGALNEVYLPPLFRKSWQEIADDPETELYFTEGELKAASGCAAGLATLGLGGVDVWRSAKRGVTFLSVLEKFVWKDRRVRIIYDSDLATNPDVVRAQRALAQELLGRGALVEIVNIPPGPNGAKVGLDDFLVQQGADKLKGLIDDALPFPESDALWGMNEEVLYVKNLDSVIERASGSMFERNRFEKGIYANRHYMETVVKKKQVSLVKKPLAPRWIEWEHRAEVERLTYSPGQPQDCGGQWNVWPGWGCQPKKGDIGPWEWLLDFIFKDDHKVRSWFLKWLAYPLQHPGAKMYAACLFWSREQRIGKGLLAYIMKAIYGENFAEIKSQDLKGNFNSWAKNRQFIFGDEINSKDAKVDADWLKGLITQAQMTIKEKYIPEYSIPDHMNYYFASNHPDALFIEDRDQRFLIHEIIGAPAPREKYEMVDKWLHQDGGPSALFYHLLSMNLGNFNPREHAPETHGKRAMQMLGKGEVGLWVSLLQEDATTALKPLGQNVAEHCDLYTPRQLYRAFDHDGKARAGESALGRALAAAGLRQLNHAIPLRTSLGLSRIYAVRNVVQWEQATKKEILEHFEKFWAADSTERNL